MTDGAAGPEVEAILCAVLLDATGALPRYRARTRRSVVDEALRRWRRAHADAGPPDTLPAAFDSVIERLAAAGLLKVGGPSDKRVQLTAAGRAHAASVAARS